MLTGDDKDAEETLNHALALAPKRVDALLARAMVRLRQSNLEGAQADVAAAADLAPDLPPVLNLRGVVSYLTGEPLAAIEDFKRASSSKLIAGAAGNNLRLAAKALSAERATGETLDEEAMQIRMTVIDSLTRLNRTVGFLEAVSGQQLQPQLKIPLAFAPALLKDVDLAAQGRLTSPLVSHTLEEIGRFGLKTLPTVVDRLKEGGKLPPSFNVPPTLFGIDKFVAGGASHIGSGRIGA
jgi:tetratricopeptide (TPR) repeat protein